MERRQILKAALAGVFGMPFALGASAAWAEEPPAAEGDFSFDVVVERARTAASAPFVRPELELTEPFAELKYDQFRAIRFRDAKRLWGEDPQGFAVDLLPPGFYFKDGVTIHLVDNGVATELPFSVDFFHFDPNYFPYPDGKAPSDLASDLGFSGFRLRHPINRPGIWDEVAVFQGASYFRAVAKDTLYGLSARGLAIGTGEPTPEEFPQFTHFWLVVPQPGDTEVEVMALLDSPSVSGAYAFRMGPGVETVIDVRLVLFPRTEIATAGLAPLTSMYFFGPDRRAGIDDFRDAVHDSSGLQMTNGAGESLWRPLTNPRELQISAFQDRNPRGFGLIQREREFAYYQDAEARYERRPSAWIEPAEDWGEGAVLLIEIPSADEFTDNIVAFWRPRQPLAVGTGHAFSYRLAWGGQPAYDRPIARVVATRSGLSILNAEERVFVVDFGLGDLAIGDLAPRLDVSAGRIEGEISLSPLPEGNVGRVGFHFVAEDAAASEFRLSLQGPTGTASEVWLYRWTA